MLVATVFDIFVARVAVDGQLVYRPPCTAGRHVFTHLYTPCAYVACILPRTRATMGVPWTPLYCCRETRCPSVLQQPKIVDVGGSVVAAVLRLLPGSRITLISPMFWCSPSSRFWECTVLPPETKEGRCRLGWSLSTGSLQGPVGYDKSSYGYRDIAGSKVCWCWTVGVGVLLLQVHVAMIDAILMQSVALWLMATFILRMREGIIARAGGGEIRV